MKIQSFLFALFLFLGTLSLSAQVSNDTTFVKPKKKSLLDVLMTQELPKLSLEMDMKTLFDDRRRMNYRKAIASIMFDDGEVWTDSIQIKTRGVYRSQKCDNPPLKLKYYKKSLKGRKLNKNNEFKLVYPCRGGEEYKNYVLKEYLVYKLNNVLTDKSLRVQLIDLEIKDSLSNLEPILEKGFLIEHREELIHRTGAIMSDVKCMKPANVSPYDYTLFQVFQFFIGNTDWLLPTCKNCEIISLEGGVMVPIAYDFDFSGMVHTEYAVQRSSLPVKRVTDRFFLGHSKTMEELAPIFALFQEKKSELIQTVDDFEHLPKYERRKMIKYIQSFYKIIDKPKLTKEHFMHPMAEVLEEY